MAEYGKIRLRRKPQSGMFYAVNDSEPVVQRSSTK